MGGRARQGTAGHGRARQGTAGHGRARQGTPGHARARQRTPGDRREKDLKVAKYQTLAITSLNSERHGVHGSHI